MPGVNTLMGEPYPEIDTGGQTQLVDGTLQGLGRYDYPLAATDGTNIGVAGLVVVALGIIILMRMGGFRAMVAVSPG